MTARFTHAAVYQVEGICRSPLRTGSADGDTQCVLARRDGTVFLQGSSLAGAMRAWLVQAGEEQTARALFGDSKTKESGHLIVSDALLEEDTPLHLRPRLRISGKSGAAEKSGKFDVAHIGCGARLFFTLTWLGKAGQLEELAAVEQLLAALDAGDITLGAQRTNGFGRLTLQVKRRVFDLCDARDREDWLGEHVEGEAFTLPRPDRRQGTVFTVCGRCSSLLVKAGAPAFYQETKEGKESQVQYVPNMEENGHPFLPGSSVKGAVRARVEAIAGLLGLSERIVDTFFGREAPKGDKSDNGLPGRIVFEDTMLDDARGQKIKRIRIDRFSGGVIRQGLLNEEPLCAGLRLHITAPEDPLCCALLLYALRDLGLGLYTLGSGQAIGRGQVELSCIEAVAPDGRRAVLRFENGRTDALEDPDGLIRQWLQKLEEVRCESVKVD